MQSKGLRGVVWLLAIWGVLGLTGCGGCTQTTPTTNSKAEELKKKLADEKKKKKPKPNYEMGLLSVQPNNLVDRQRFVKPGHLTSGTVDCIANNFDVMAVLSTDPYPLDGVAYELGTVRPATMPKGQPRSFEAIFHVPERVPDTRFMARLNPTGGGRPLLSTPAAMQLMPAHQFYFLVLATDQDRYKYWEDLPSFKTEVVPLITDEPNRFYRLVLPPVAKRAPLPSSMLAWTSMAYILWDDLPPHVITDEQQTAFIDWLHWGGQLIVSGPGSLDTLRGSFLEPYLPAEATGTVELGSNDLAKLEFSNASAWTNNRTLKITTPTTNKPWGCDRLKLKHPDASILLSAPDPATADPVPLIVELPVGRGRVVLTSFRLTQPELANWRTNWRDFDTVVNACLLRRPGREYQLDPQEDVAHFSWVTNRGQRPDQLPQLASRMNFFARDTGAGKHRPAWIPDLQALVAANNQFAVDDKSLQGPGVAGWDDWNHVSQESRSILDDATGINVPERMFVVRVLAYYLIILVPLNWFIFRVIGRVEWAWISAPLITIAFTVAVVKLAELNIGFARSRTEINVVEVQGNHPRAHVSRYTALYTSLTTGYTVTMNDRTGLVQPLSEPDQLSALRTRDTLWLRRENDVRLEGFQVDSNTRGMLHAEQMLDLGGSIKVTELTDDHIKVVNDSNFTLRSAEVYGTRGLANLGDIAPGAEATANFGTAPKRLSPNQLVPSVPTQPSAVEVDVPVAMDPFDPILQTVPAVPSSNPPARNLGDFSIDRLRDVARYTKPDELRLIAWSDETLPGMDITPAASQNRTRNLFVVHLRHSALALPEPDSKTLAQAAIHLFNKKPAPVELDLEPSKKPR